jgi:phosphatidylethanolamine/phosphatidyl-N-methylethanolamine N-methyltransferase
MLMNHVSTDQLSAVSMDRDVNERLYARFASVYNAMFGPILHAGRREAMRALPLRTGDEILEVGIGTGLTATLYPSDCRVMGIDLSEPMLREAARHVESEGRTNVRLWRMDASSLGFPDESFDVVYAAYVISVVPDPVAVLKEMRRVCRVGGHIVLLNHFLSTDPVLSLLERWLAPLTARRRSGPWCTAGANCRGCPPAGSLEEKSGLRATPESSPQPDTPPPALRHWW